MVDFISLHNQTSYSLLDSLIEPKQLFQRAAELSQKAIAITDHQSLASAWDALKASKETGVKLIIGCECYFVDDGNNKEDKFRHIILLARNAIGYKNLLTINKKGFDQSSSIGRRVYSVIDWKILEEHKEGLICLTACGNGIVSRHLMKHQFQEAEKTLLRLKDIFGDYLGVEILPNNMKRGANIYNEEIDQNYLNRQLINLGKKHNVRVVAACNAHYLKKEDADTHDLFLAIGSHQPKYSNFRLKYPVEDFYLKTGDEVKAFFARNYGEEAAESFCANSVYFADLCESPEWIDPKFSNPTGKELPIFPVKDEPNYAEFLEWKNQQDETLQTLDEDKLFLRYRCQKYFNVRLPNLSAEQLPIYQARVEEELSVFEFQGFSSYMLIVADFIDWARKNDIAIGAGRGSVGGSLVAYLLNIHQADPIKYDLIFARFQNRLRTNPPDIDTDIAPSGRERVQNYIRQKYGADHVAHVSNINTITPKVYVRDIARACELGGSKEEAIRIGNLVADCIPKDVHTMKDVIEKVPMFGEYCKKYPEFLKYKEICGKFRSWSTHAAGFVVAARPLVGLVPLRKDKDGAWAIEYDKDTIEENGLIKIDTLGLSTLDTMGLTLQLIRSVNKSVPEIDYNENDLITYDLISKGDTFCVFQLGTSAGTIDLCKNVKPTSIDDISNINSLARPSAKNIRTDFIKARRGEEKVVLLHPKLNRAFGSTYGFGLYEECLMFLAQDIAGWDLHKADRLRKFTKDKGKNPKKAQELKEEFIRDAIKNNIKELIASRIWELVEGFGSYGFNHSHSVLYSMTSYATAYYKAHYPIEFLLANLMAEIKSNAPDAQSNVDKCKKELRQHKVKILPPDLNKSQLAYTLVDESHLITGLDAIKFVGDDAIKDIIAKRPFKNFFDFMLRVSSKTVRSNSIQALAASGALDCFKIPRKLIYLYCSDYRKKLQVWQKKHDPQTEKFEYPWPENEKDWTIPEIYALEQHYMNEAFICKPPTAYGKFFDDNPIAIKDIKKMADKTPIYNFKGIVRDFYEFRIKKEGKYYGKSMAKILLEDKNGEQLACTIFTDKWDKLHDRLKMLHKKEELEIGMGLFVSGSANMYNEEMGLIINDTFNIVLSPALPVDLKAKKTTIKRAPKTEKPKSKKEMAETTPEDIFDEIQDQLYDEGLIDLDVAENDE